MKRIIALTVAVLTLSIVSLAFIGAYVGGTADNVGIEETVLYGDRAVADGISVLSRVNFRHHLFWQTNYTVGEAPVYHTEYDFTSIQRFEDSEKVYAGVDMETSIPHGCDFNVPAEDQEGIARAYKELYDTVAPGEERSRTVRLADYYDYYPISLEIDLPNVQWYRTGSNAIADKGSVTYVRERFYDFFKIPVSDTAVRSISIGREKNGSISIGSSVSAQEGDLYYMDTVSTYTENTCYFTISNKEMDGTPVDLSHIEDGYGIYSIAFGVNTARSGIDADSLGLVYALDPSVTVLHMSINGDALMLYTLEDEQTVLTVIDIADMTARQRLVIGDVEYSYIWEYDDFAAFTFSRNDRLALIVKQADGTWRHEFTVPTAASLGFSMWHEYNTVMDYKDGRLAVLNRLQDTRYGTSFVCSYHLAVYGEEGLLYLGMYQNSLDLSQGGGNSTLNCLPSGNDPYTVKWGE